MALRIYKNLVIISLVFYLAACDKGEQTSGANSDTQKSSAMVPAESKSPEYPVSAPEKEPVKDVPKTLAPTSSKEPVTPPLSPTTPTAEPVAIKNTESQEDVLQACKVMIQNLGDDGIKTLKGSKADRYKREEQFLPLFVKNFNVEKIGKFVLGRYARGSITPEEFKEFLEIFQKTIVSIYANRLGKYDDEKFVAKEATFSGASKGGEQMVYVKSLVLSKDKAPINIVWSVVVTKDGKGIVDVAVEGVSQAFTQRQEYADVLNNGGITNLIKRLKANYAETTKK